MGEAIGLLHKRHGLTPRGIVHVGANSGQEVPNYRESGIRPVVLIEALPGPFEALQTAIAGEPRFYPVLACCSDQAGQMVDFHVASNGGESSSMLAPTGHLNAYPGIRFAEVVKVTTTTLDDIIAETATANGFPLESLDYLAMDTQGAELKVLHGGTRVLEHVRYIFTEVAFGGLYAGDVGFYDLIDYLRSFGFDLYQVKMRKERWGDALFIRPG